MSLNFNEVFASAVDQSVKDWKSFQLCVDHGMGGQQTNEKLVWMTQTIVDFFNTNNDLTVDEVMQFVAEIIDNEFDTIIDDGSLHIFANNISRYYQLCSSGRLQEVIDSVEDIRQRTERLSVINSSQLNDNQSSVENQMKSLQITNEFEDQTQEPDDGWTRVQRKHRK